MNHKILISIILVHFFLLGINQKKLSAAIQSDTILIASLLEESKNNFGESPEYAISLAQKALKIADSLDYLPGRATALKNIGIGHYIQNRNIQALDYWQRSMDLYKLMKDENGEANILSNIGAIFFNQGDDAKALEYYLKALSLAEKKGDKLRMATVLNNIGGIYNNKESTKKKALDYFLKALPLSRDIGDNEAYGTLAANIGEIYFDLKNDTLALTYFNMSREAYNGPFVYNAISKVYLRQNKYNLAISFNNKALFLSEKLKSNQDIVQSLIGLARAYYAKRDFPNCLKLLKQAAPVAVEFRLNKELKDIYADLSEVYSKTGDYKNAYIFQQKYAEIKDTLYNLETDKKLGLLQFEYELLKKETEISDLTKAKEAQSEAIRRQRVTILAILLGLLLIVFTALNLFRTLKKLKATQAQLIQSEKMASLGSFTAGIAHEIQNPLNFVNNFSDLNTELIDEMNEELEKGSLDEAKSIASDIRHNMEKIHQHGTRASEIIKGMLQHSRIGTGQSEFTDINALCNEFLKLSYHGQRAKNKSFNAGFETDFEISLAKIEVVQQDISRVILNIINNAFYAVNEKSKANLTGYEPKVKVSTSKLGDKIVIKIADNGTGMPKNIKDKIFQPFFSTKPTGEGTGLGLSLSYDVIKAHGGTLTVDTVEGEGTVFTIILPINRGKIL